MLTTPMDALREFPVRKNKKQKQAFRDAVLLYAQSLGYSCTIEKGSFGSRNVVIGDPNTAQHLVTAHYDTCAGMIVPNLITPCNFWTYLGYQLFVVLLMLLPPLAIGIPTGIITNSFETGYLVWYGCFILMLVLMLAGPANPTNANDNTSGVVTVLSIMEALPREQRHRVCFVLFDLEEAGLIGSRSYRKTHTDSTDDQIVWNLDCVGDGDVIQFVPMKKGKKDPALLEKITTICGMVGKKELRLRYKGFTAGSSDHKNFPYGVGIMAFHNHKRIGLYCGRIHTKRDTVLEEDNVNILRDRLLTVLAD